MLNVSTRLAILAFTLLVGIAATFSVTAMPSYKRLQGARSTPTKKVANNKKIAKQRRPARRQADSTFVCRAPLIESIPAEGTVLEINAAALAQLLPRANQSVKDARPLLVNFWATWCEPCRVEFPDLVRIDNEFRTRGLDFFTVSLDDKAELATTVPAFLREMRATRIPAYLLNTPEPADAINLVDPAWSGALPATFLFDRNGKLVYKHTGRIVPAELRAAIKKVTSDK